MSGCWSGGHLTILLKQDLEHDVVERLGPVVVVVFLRPASALVEFSHHRGALVELSSFVVFERRKAIVEIFLLFFLQDRIRGGRCVRALTRRREGGKRVRLVMQKSKASD